MLRKIESRTENLVAIEAIGVVTGEDYEFVLIPALERALAAHDKIRFLYLFGPEFEEFTADALWLDAKIGVQRLRAFERCAIVTDISWVTKAARAFGPFIPCPVGVFGLSEMAAARTWIEAPASASGLELSIDEEDECTYVTAKLTNVLTADDERRLGLEIDRALETHPRFRVLLLAEDFHGWGSLEAAWEHLKFVAQHEREAERIALVGDATWQRRLLALARTLIGVDARFFRAGDLDEARKWLREEQPHSPRVA